MTSIGQLFDKSVGFLLLQSCFNSAFLMYYILTHLTKFRVKDYYILIAFILSFFSFIAKVESASCVKASSFSVKKVAREIVENIHREVCVYMKFIKNVKEISMTLWGVATMTRNLIFGISGAILTYCLLFDDILNF